MTEEVITIENVNTMEVDNTFVGDPALKLCFEDGANFARFSEDDRFLTPVLQEDGTMTVHFCFQYDDLGWKVETELWVS